MTVIKIVPMPGVPVEGPQGPQGPAGQDGDSAYQVAVNNGFEGTEQEWLDSLGGGGSADIADFTFQVIEDEGTESRMTVANHDMIIRTTRTDDEDADISIDSADDIWIDANDEIRITSADGPITLNAPGGVFLTTDQEPNNQIATIGDILGASSLVVPTAIKDSENDDFITFTKTNMGTARIATPQDDLSLRSARDITLYAGDDGPGNVYIGWGDAVYTPDSTNRVATIADIQSAGTGGITFVDNTISTDNGDDIIIQNKNQDNVVKARIVLDQSNEQVLVEAINPNTDWFYSSQWATAEWSGDYINFTDAIDVYNFFINPPGNVTGISVNDGVPMQWYGANYGEGTVSLNVSGTSQDPTTVTEMRVYYTISSKVDIDYDNGSFDIVSKGMSMTIDSSGDLDINARDEDIDLRANDDIRFTANWNAGGTEPQWRMANSGRFELPGAGYIENVIDGSGDGYNNDTLKLVPDADLESDQYVIIDPTAPNHIHIRAGGEQDASNANLFLGAERTNVVVSDNGRNVGITTRPSLVINTYLNTNPENGTNFVTGSTADIQIGYIVNVDGIDYVVDAIMPIDEGVVAVTANGAVFNTAQGYTFRYEQPWDNYWSFNSDGVFTGPAMGGVKVPAIANSADGNDLYVYSTGANVNIEANDGAVNIAAPEININSSAVPSSLNINTYSGAVINSARTSTYDVEDKVVATLGDLGLISLTPGPQGEQGPQGEPGTGFRFMGEWDDIRTFVINDVVTFNGECFISIQGSTVVSPYDTQYWSKLAAKGADTGASLDSYIRYSPTFSATGLTFTGADETYPTYNSYYIKAGKMVSFVIEVDLSTVTNFGTGQYKLQLPFTPAFGFNHFTGWVWADPDVSPDTGTGHTIINADTAGVTDVLDLHYLKSAGGANSPIREGLLNHNTPVTLSTISKIYVNGTYIAL